MRPIQTFVFSIMLCSSVLIAEETAKQQSSQLDLDELISKMNSAHVTERFKYMNKIKKRLKQMNADQRIKVINKLQQKINDSKAASLSQAKPAQRTPEVKKVPMRPSMPPAIPVQPPVQVPSIPSIPGR